MQSRIEIAQEARRARQFTEFAFGIAALAALAALALASVIHSASLPIDLPDETRRVMAWSFVGLAGLDAVLLMIWNRVCRWIALRQ